MKYIPTASAVADHFGAKSGFLKNDTENMPLTLQTFANLCEFLCASVVSILRFPKCDNDLI